MAELTTCKGCSAPIPKPQRYCGGDHCLVKGTPDTSRPASAPWSSWRVRRDQADFRARLMREFGGQCAAVGGLSTFVDLEQGSRCTVTDPSRLDAHHGKDGLPDLLLCDKHHAEIDPHARRRR